MSERTVSECLKELFRLQNLRRQSWREDMKETDRAPMPEMRETEASLFVAKKTL